MLCNHFSLLVQSFPKTAASQYGEALLAHLPAFARLVLSFMGKFEQEKKVL
jgi:hypothetical protein